MKIVSAVLAAGLAGGFLLVFGALELNQQFASGGSPLQRVEIVITDHGADLATPSNFVVRAGIPVAVTVVNHTREAHTFTSEGLGVNELVPAARSAPTRITFTVLPRKGTFRWRCIVPCGDMWGYVIALPLASTKASA